MQKRRGPGGALALLGHRPPPRREPIKGRPGQRSRMHFPLQEGVQTGVIDASGWVVLLSSLAVTLGWLWYLYR